VEADAEADVAADVEGDAVTVCVTVCVTVGVVGVGVTVGVAVTLGVGVGAALVVGEGEGEGDAEADGLGDAVAALTGSHDSLPPCAATAVAATAAAAAAALLAVSANRPQEPAASRTPVADRATAVRRARVKRIENAFASTGQYRRDMDLSVRSRDWSARSACYHTPFAAR
jgi:pyruvate/2-oxoglutarate dehydrogenase complex dihydrolipoamide acyltransferase (E2) component